MEKNLITGHLYDYTVHGSLQNINEGLKEIIVLCLNLNLYSPTSTCTEKKKKKNVKFNLVFSRIHH